MSKPTSGLVPAVGYARASTDKQDTSVGEQIKAVENYAAERGYKIIRWYQDDGISGDATEKRLGFQAMYADATGKKDFKHILVWDQSRFGRFSPQEGGHWSYLFGKAGVKLVTVDKGLIDWDEFTGFLTYSVDQYAKHEYLKNLSKDVARGQAEAVSNGGHVGSPPYAYTLTGPRKHRKLVPGDPSQVAVVRRIFKEYVTGGKNLSQIADGLNADGFATPSGGDKWRYDSVKTILSNPAYTGDFVGGKYAYGKYHTSKGGKVVKNTAKGRNPQAEWVIRRDAHEPMVDRDVWEQAQAKLAKGKTGTRPNTRNYLLAGLLRCGLCGCNMFGEIPGKVVPGKHRVKHYECGNRHRHGPDACPGTSVREDVVLYSLHAYLDAEFYQPLDAPSSYTAAGNGEVLPTDSLTSHPAYAKIKSLLSPAPAPKVDRTATEALATGLRAKLDKATKNLVHLDAEFIPDAQAEIRKLKAQLAEAEAELAPAPNAPTADDLNAEVKRVLESLHWVRHFAGSAAQEAKFGDPEEFPENWVEFCQQAQDDSDRPAWVMSGTGQQLSKFLRAAVAGITVHTTIQGMGRRTRHVFVKGVIELKADGVNTGDSNLHGRLQRPMAYR